MFDPGIGGIVSEAGWEPSPIALRGDVEAARLAMRFADLARDAVEDRGGRVIELRGDDVLAVFTSSSQAGSSGSVRASA